MINKKQILTLTILTISILSNTITFADSIKVQVTQNDSNKVSAHIENLDKKHELYEKLNQIELIGKKTSQGQINSIEWNKVKLNNKDQNLPTNFKSKIKGDVHSGSKFSAEGNYESIINAMENLMNKEQKENQKKATQNNQNGNTQKAPSSFSSFSPNTRPLSAYNDPNNNTTTQVQVGDTISTNAGCMPYIDYTLNTVYLQERVIRAGEEIDSCKNSTTSFKLEKDYAICPDKKDLNTLTNTIYFQYFYTDTRNNLNTKNNIADCQKDTTKSGNIPTTKNYTNCSDFTDLNHMIVYKQYQTYYTDADNKQILLKTCQKDTDKRYTLIENYSNCSLKHYFEKAYSLETREIGYNDSNAKYTKVYDCLENENKKHTHAIESCPPVTTTAGVQIFQKKYITINGTKQYITECQPLAGNFAIQQENCQETPYTHDGTTNQSFQNVNTYYINSSNNKQYVSRCVKSETTFKHKEDLTVCNNIDNDTTKKTTIYSRTYIEPQTNIAPNIKTYIGVCKANTTKQDYKSVGYVWTNEFISRMLDIQVSNTKDNTFIGSQYGTESGIIDLVYKDTKIINTYPNIAQYQTQGKCDGFTNPTYNGNTIDMNLSESETITLNNYIENKSANPVCYNRCTYKRFNPNRCETLTRSCSQANTLYHQRCTKHKCPLTKAIKHPIYKRSNNTNYTDKSTNLEVKYICGNKQVYTGQEIFY